ncbi:MAG: ATP synthase A1 subunit C [Candidatus Thermoplasmatota archaeon]
MRGNYPYVCARVNAKKARLLPKDTYQKLLLMETSEISRFIGESEYRKEIEELGGKYKGIDLIEFATYLNLARTYQQILSFCSGELRFMVEQYLRRWDIWNIKTILRSKVYGAKAEEVLEDLVPAGTYKIDFLSTLIPIRAIDETVEALKDTDYYDTLVKQKESLRSIEDSLDRAYYKEIVKKVKPTTASKKLFLQFIRHEIDYINLRTLLKMKAEDISAEHIIPFFIDGGMLSKEELKKLALTEPTSILQILGEYPDYKNVAEESKNISNAIVSLEKNLMKMSEKFSYLYPLSVLPILNYIISKKIEADNVRIIGRGKDSGLGDDIIRSMLVV